MIRLLVLLLALVFPVSSWAAIAAEGTYAGSGAKTTGAQSVTNVTIPASVTVAIVELVWFDDEGDSPGSITLDGQACTNINSQIGVAHNSVRTCWATGMAAGASKTLAWTNSAGLDNGIGIRIGFLSGTETVSAIRDAGSGSSALDGNVDFSGLTFTAGDWTILSIGSDNTGVLLDGGANTQLVAESASDGITCGISYRTDGGAIGTPSSVNSFLGATAFVIKAAGGGPTPPPLGSLGLMGVGR